MNKQELMNIAQALVASVKTAQQALLQQARCNRAARRGEYSAAMEVTGA